MKIYTFRRRYKKKQLSTTNNSIMYKTEPLSITVPDGHMVDNEPIKTITTMSPLDSPTTIYSLENGSAPANNFLLTSANGPTPHQSFDTVDNNRYVLKEVYTLDKKAARKERAKRAFSSKSWDKKWGSVSLLGTSKKKQKTERIYKPVYIREPYSTMPAGGRVYGYGSNPTLVRAYPASVSSIPGGPTRVGSNPHRLYVVDKQPFSSSQSVILTRSPRSPRSMKFSSGTSYDELTTGYDNDVFNRSHNVSHDSLGIHDHVDGTARVVVDPDANYMKWSPSMRQRLEEKDRVDATRSNSEITSVSRSGKRRGVGEHKYIYSKQDGTLMVRHILLYRYNSV